MNLKLRYLFTAMLVLYWPCIFFLAHVPQVPHWLLQTQMSDKTLHYLGYLVLIFLWWFSFFPSKRPSFFSYPLWLTTLMMIVYAAGDEYLQQFVHRTPDFRDFAADMAGVATGLAIFAFAGLRISSLSILAICIFILTGITKTDPLGFVPLFAISFYFLAYGFATILWMDHLSGRLEKRGPRFILFSILLPAGLLAGATFAAAKNGKQVEPARIIAGASGIAAFLIFYFLFLFLFTKRSRRVVKDPMFR